MSDPTTDDLRKWADSMMGLPSMAWARSVPKIAALRWAADRIDARDATIAALRAANDRAADEIAELRSLMEADHVEAEHAIADLAELRAENTEMRDHVAAKHEEITALRRDLTFERARLAEIDSDRHDNALIWPEGEWGGEATDD